MPEIPEEAAMSVRSRWMLISVYSVIVCGSCEALKARLRGSVELPCEWKHQTYPIEELLVYWQRNIHGKEELVAGLVGGKENTQKQHEEYKGRASLNPSKVANGDFTLHLSGLSLRDNGTYNCYVFLTETYISLHKATAELHVTAEYSTPVIANGSSERTLTCTTQGGIPQPGIRWINATDGTLIDEGQIHINNIDQEDEDFINVTSVITINVTSTTNISCVIITASGNLTSETYLFELPNENPGAGKHEGVVPGVWNSVIVVVILIIAVVLIVVVVLKRQFFPLTGCSQRIEYQQGKAEI